MSVRGLPRATPRTQVTVAILLHLLELAAATSDQRGPSCWGCVQCGSVWSGCGRAAVGPRFGGAAGGCCRSAAWASLSLGGAGGGGVCGDGVRVRAACSALSRPTLQMGTRRHEAGCPRSELDVGTACALSRPKCREAAKECRTQVTRRRRRGRVSSAGPARRRDGPFCVRPQRPPDPFNTCFFFFFFSKPSHCDGSRITNQLSTDLHGAWCL